MIQKLNEAFYPLTPSTAQKLRKAKLTAAEWRLWSYLVEIDPYGERYHDLDTLTAMQSCQMSKTTLWRAMCKFQDLELFDFQDGGFHFKNETGVSKMKQAFQKRNRNFKNETEISKMKPEVSKMKFSDSENLSQQDFQNASEDQTNTDFKDSLSDSEREKNSVSQKEEITRSEKTSNDFSHSNLTPSSSSSNSLVSDKNLGLDQKRRQNHSLTKSLNSHITSPNSAERSAPQTYSDFIQTLSEGEREKFLDFVTEQIKDFAQPINDVEAWLASKNKAYKNRWEVYYNNFKAEQKAKSPVRKKRRSLREEIEQRRLEVQRLKSLEGV